MGVIIKYQIDLSHSADFFFLQEKELKKQKQILMYLKAHFSIFWRFVIICLINLRL
jgi:hypothetical protein